MMAKIKVKKIADFEGNKTSVYGLAGLASHRYFFSGNGEGLVVLWDLEEVENGHVLARLPHSVYALHYHKQSDLLIVGHNQDGIHAFDWRNKKEVGSLQFTDAAIYAIESYQNLLFSATEKGVLEIVDLKTLSVVNSIALSKERLRCIAIHEETGRIAVGASDQMIYLLSLQTLKLEKAFPAHGTSVFSLQFNKEGNLLYSTGKDAKIKVWSMRNNAKKLNSIDAHMYAVNALRLNDKEDFFITGSMDKTIKIWDNKTGQLLKVVDNARHEGHISSVNRLIWVTDRSFLSASDDKKISLWEFSEI